jgi:hypothetical protein
MTTLDYVSAGDWLTVGGTRRRVRSVSHDDDGARVWFRHRDGQAWVWLGSVYLGAQAARRGATAWRSDQPAQLEVPGQLAAWLP